MIITLNLNHKHYEWDISPSETLLEVLRRNGLFSVKSGGCRHGECGACTVLFDGKPINACNILAAQADGHRVQTVESMGEHPEKGWKTSLGLHPIQQAMVDSGAIQCGYCTPAMVLEAKYLLEKNPRPTEADVREALAPVLCRCTGYLKPIQAILRAAAVLRGEENPHEGEAGFPIDLEKPAASSDGPVYTELDQALQTKVLPRITLTPESKGWNQVGKPEKKVDSD